MANHPSVDDLLHRLETLGQGAYGLSDVSQLEHALQSAALAAERGLGDGLTVAALFHDVGHLIDAQDVDLASQGIDDGHEDASAALLAPLFGPAVAEPVRLHVAAKRYLCAVEPAYMGRLSRDSVRSLALQGGVMAPAEIGDFERNPHHGMAVALRRIDDEAKVPGLEVPPISAYRTMAEALASR